MAKRKATVQRTTQETNISLELNLDGTGKYEISTGIKMLDHLLSQTVKHGRFDLKGTVSGTTSTISPKILLFAWARHSTKL